MTITVLNRPSILMELKKDHEEDTSLPFCSFDTTIYLLENKVSFVPKVLNI
jgi:hypothetical protein